MLAQKKITHRTLYALLGFSEESERERESAQEMGKSMSA